MNLRQGIFNRAIKVAQKSEYYPFRIAAIIFKGNRIFAEGINRIGSCSKLDVQDKFIQNSIHAEADALSKLNIDKTKGASILIIRINAGSNKLSIAKPCEICQRLIFKRGIKKIYASDENGNIAEYKVIQPEEDFVVDYEKTEHSYSDKFILRLG